MPGNALNGLIDTLVQSIERDAAALRQRYVLRQSLQAQAAEHVARIRRDALRLAGGAGGRCGQQSPQQACSQQR
jgi:hypothetical protein